jgi:hypothetical protein
MRAWRRVALAAAMGLAAGAQAPAPPCHVPPFRGSGQGRVVDGSMFVANTGAACRLRLWADVEARRPYETIVITRPPAQGTVVVVSDGVMYRPNRGYAGTDVFEMTASGIGRGGLPTGGVFRIGVTVAPPP